MVIDEQPTAENIARLLERCAMAVQVGRHNVRQEWGLSEAARLLRDARDGGFGDAVNLALTQFLESGRQRLIYLALHFAPDDVFVKTDIRRIDSSTLEAPIQESLRATLGALTSKGLIDYTPSWREDVQRPGGDSALPALIVFDHAWFWAHLHEVLGQRVAFAKPRLALNLEQLSADEIQLLADEMRANTPAIDPTWAQELAEFFDHYLAAGGATASGLPHPRFDALARS